MNTLESIGNLIEHLTGKVEILMDERERMLTEISILRKCLMERDKEAVKVAQNMRNELETAHMNVLRFEQEQIRTEARFKILNDKLTALAGGERHCGG